MDEKNKYKGPRWYKCDFHLHTSASVCFEDENKSKNEEKLTEDFINKVIEKNLDCIAITDHNTGKNIDTIKAAAAKSKRRITVFPGVEITCGEAKIHILVLFDPVKGTREVEDFLLRLGLEREDFGKLKTQVNKEVYEVLKLVNEANAIAIPAHIDEYNGISNISSDESKKRLFDEKLFGAVQIVHEPLLNKEINFNKNEPLHNYLKKYYENNKDFSLKHAEKWNSCNKYLGNIAKVTFSDNPKSKEEPNNHGLEGIGTSYTWIKMCEPPCLEGLRQAFMFPETRIKNDFQSKEAPALPEIWISKVICINTTLTEKNKEITFNFSPQMTTIIGSRGTGKSSVIRFIRGLFNKCNDMKGLPSIINEFDNFYKFATIEEENILKEDSDLSGKIQKIGVFNEDSVLIVEIYKKETLYRITSKKIKSMQSQEISIENFDNATESFIQLTAAPVTYEEFLKLFDFEIYAQKQIYEIAQSPNALRERIDSSITEMVEFRGRIKDITNQYLTISSKIREIRGILESKKKLNAELSEIQTRISAHKESAIEPLQSQMEKFSMKSDEIEDLKSNLESKKKTFDVLINELEALTSDTDETSEELRAIFKNKDAVINQSMQEIKNAYKIYQSAIETLSEGILKSQWKKDLQKNKDDIEMKKNEFGKIGIQNIDDFEDLIKQKEIKIKDIAKFDKFEDALKEELMKKEKIMRELCDKRKAITEARKSFLEKILENQNVQILVQKYSDNVFFKNEFYNIIQKQNCFEQSINHLADSYSKGKFKEAHKNLDELRKGEIPKGFAEDFKNCIENLDDSQFDKLKILFPEDKIIAKYKQPLETEFKPISKASAGQKTSTILTFILAHGTTPLILDQPEDDLDNRLVYDFLVDRLKASKEKRQIIVVSHNANIPVNGDSELITVMSESEYLTVTEGTLEEPTIKEAICDIMEGGKEAFEKRARRYDTKLDKTNVEKPKKT